VPPVADNVVLAPLHKPLVPDVILAAALFRLTAIVLVWTQPFFIPVTVYVTLVYGRAETEAPVVALNPVAGAQLYVVAPEATSDAAVPLQTETAGLFTVIVNPPFTVTAIVFVALHPAP
jgi:hypothetical protein